MSDSENQPQPIELDPALILVAHLETSRRRAREAADRESDAAERAAHLEAYIEALKTENAALTARAAELEAAVNAAPGDAWGDPSAKEN